MSNDFQNVLGGILSALAQGRNLSDQVSRELSVQYADDDTMRAFPVPRVELDNVQIELKFAVTSQAPATTTEPAPALQKAVSVPTASLAANLTAVVDPGVVDRLIQNTSFNVASAVSNSITDLTKGGIAYGFSGPRPSLAYPGEIDTPPPYPSPYPAPLPTYDLSSINQVTHGLVSSMIAEPTRAACATPPQPGVTMETFALWPVAQRIVNELYAQQLIQFGTGSSPTFVIEQLAQFVLPMHKQRHENEVMNLRQTLVQPPPSEPTPTEPVPTTPEPDPVPAPEPQTEDPTTDPTAPTAPVQTAPISIVTRYQDLMMMPPEVISTLKLSINVKNYEWTQVDEQEGQAVRKLVPE